MTPPIDAAQVHRWQEEVARDPGSASFLPLAEVYRREGKLDVARRLCVRGLERHPEQVEAHFLLGRIYRESGDLEKAFDELDIALSLEPGHPAARRAIGYLCLERRDWEAAVRHLEEAARHDPSDERVASALALARRHARSGATAAPGGPEALLKSLDPIIDHFVRESRVRLVLVTEGSGKIVAQRGFTREVDIAAFATLGAGIQSASRA
jgi:tetratricopeptide (TPR) repeat protein